MSKITFLGTAGDSSVTGRQIRGSGGIIIKSGELQFHLDPGPGALVRAKEFNVNPRATSAILVSHNHLNHVNDINAVIDAMTLGGMDKRGVLLTNESVVHGNDEMSNSLNRYHRSLLEKILFLRPGEKAAVENVEVRAVGTAHSDPDALGFVFNLPKRTVGYTGDTAYTEKLAEQLHGCDVLILNTTYPEDRESDVHLTTESATKLVDDVKPQLAIITHFGFDMIKADPLFEARNIQIATGVQTTAATDGMSIDLSTYTSKSSEN